jgi:predicted GNAT family N-acyltransferase
MFAVQQQQVEAGAGADLGRVVIRQANPQSDLGTFFLERALEEVDW